MQVKILNNNSFQVVVSPTERTLLERECRCPVDWPIHDPASLIQYTIEQLLEYCEVRYGQ